MEFSDNKAIYIQIAEHICEHIMLGTWKEEEKLPSVRELAVQLEVNPNTVMRTYDLLQQKEIIANKRGVGFFVTKDSLKQVQTYRKNIFLEDELPQVFRNIYLLDISLEELKKRYQDFVDENFN
ncbi:GntR family transcriptional regulator [Sphingobacterium paludis]|jgi:GntR family transcriptional regulator|uniref:GntR family transcriptional regulator n=1 Tax=Sphingobacterium paludis TaxID=1476465 RepID=A0A4R7CU88_9SPHI|nr:GntR family transcriptional regulator [Sphingobacterium paludis]TDS11680.1 GntR family transcriptional regulator [Sphingobacterium paludis]